jgi:hypothetical protein
MAVSVASAKPTRLFRFFVWNDMHIRADVPDRHEGYPFANEKAVWALECANGQHGFEPPDFILSLGDIIDGEIPDYRDDFRLLKTLLLSRLKVPFLPCVGNHENGQGEGMPERYYAYDWCFGEGWRNYVFTCKGIGFIVLDTSGAHRLSDEVTGARNAFLERAFRFLRDVPVILATHVPLVPMRDEEILKASFGFESWKVRDGRTLEIVNAHADQVIAVFSGHLHLTAAKWVNRIAHITPAGTGGYPADFASVEVYSDRIEVRMHPAPKRLLDSKGNIHGTPRHKQDYTDADHPTHERYLWGNPDEREITIPLEGSKRPSGDQNRLRIFHEIEAGVWNEVTS